MGMHRSGTSFTARALQLLGVSLGAAGSLMAPGPDNPAGYFENRDIKELNDAVLAHLGGSWDQPPRSSTGGTGGTRAPCLSTVAAGRGALAFVRADRHGIHHWGGSLR